MRVGRLGALMKGLRAIASRLFLALALLLIGWAAVLMVPGVQPDTRLVENKIFVALVAAAIPAFVALLLGLLFRPPIAGVRAQSDLHPPADR